MLGRRHREIFSKSCCFKPNLDYNYLFPIDLPQKEIRIGVKSIRKLLSKSKFGWDQQDSEMIPLWAMQKLSVLWNFRCYVTYVAWQRIFFFWILLNQTKIRKQKVIRIFLLFLSNKTEFCLVPRLENFHYKDWGTFSITISAK